MIHKNCIFIIVLNNILKFKLIELFNYLSHLNKLLIKNIKIII